MGEQKNEIPNWQLYCIMLLMLATGTANTLVMKMQDEVVVGKKADGKDLTFTHPYF